MIRTDECLPGQKSQDDGLIRSLRFESLTLTRASGRDALTEVTCEFPSDEIFWIQGPNGSGKSLLLRILAGLDDPTCGHYRINGIDVASQSFEAFAPIQKRIGFSFEFGGLMANKTVRQNLMLPFFYHRNLEASEAETRVREYSDLFNLTPVSDQRPASISGGRRKAGCVARALITQPELLLMDQPTAGLDERNKQVLLGLLARHRAEHGLRYVFIVSDDDRFMSRLPHKVLSIENQALSLLDRDGRTEQAS